jgi:ABC-2 type transport system ATP-binding protein
MLAVREVCKSFGEVRAADEVSFTAKPGEIFGLLGPNGAGKSTIIRIIMNILGPDTGEVTFDGKRISEEDKDRIGYLPEERGLYRKVKVSEMLLYLAGLKGMDKERARGRMAEWLERFELSDWAGRKIEELSKGMAQKIQLVATILHDPQFIFLDEPFSGLDPVSTDVLREAILDLGKEGKTILFSTHNMEQAERICRRIFIIDHGREVISGTVDEVKSRFGKNTVAVEFDGDAEFLEHSSMVRDLVRYPRWVEVELAPGASPDELLSELAGRISVRRFEVVTPSLHKIFVRQLGGRSEESAS